MSWSVAIAEFFGAIKEIASKVPNFSEEKKEMLEKETKHLYDLSEKLNNASLEFKAGSRPDEILGLADKVAKQEKKLKDLIILYAKELRG